MKVSSTDIIKKLLIAFLILGGLYYAKDFLVPLVIAGMLATLLLPVNNAMERHRIPRVMAILLSLLIVLAILSGIGLIFGLQIYDLSEDFALLKQKILDLLDYVGEKITAYTGVSVEMQSQILKNQQVSISSMIQNIASSVTGFVSYFSFVMAYVFFILYYRHHLRKFLMQLISEDKRDEMNDIIDKASKVSQEYLLGLIKMIALLWVMYGIGFGLLGVRNAIFFAFVCGLLELIPYIGNLTGTTLTILFSATHGESIPMLTGIAVVYGIIQFIQGWVLEPLILGPQVRINSLFTIIALVVGGMVWGIAGVFLAIPIMGVSKIVFDHIDSLRPYGFLIGEMENKK